MYRIHIWAESVSERVKVRNKGQDRAPYPIGTNCEHTNATLTYHSLNIDTAICHEFGANDFPVGE